MLIDASNVCPNNVGERNERNKLGGHRMNFKHLLLIAIFTFVTISTYSQNVASSALPETSPFALSDSGCAVYAPTLPPDTKIHWAGDCVAGQISGVGVLEARNAQNAVIEKYIGSVEKGKRSGQGELLMGDGSSIIGMWHDGQIEGDVIFQSGYGFRYIGSWKDGHPEGYGAATWANGGAYTGNWHAGKKSGFGHQQESSSGMNYVGNFINDERSGRGVLTFRDGGVLDAIWDHNRPAGMVMWINGKGQIYKGELENFKRNGQGLFLWSDGSIYEGSWEGSLPDGEGTYIDAQGSPFSGIWRKGCFTKNGRTIALFVEEVSCRAQQ